MIIKNLRVNDQINPIGIYLKDLTFSWQVENAKGTKAEKSRLLIASDPDFIGIVFDSMEADLPSHAYTPSLEGLIEDGTTYYFKISVKDNAGDLASSDVGTFEGGRKGSFSGKWITPRFARNLHPVMQKSFSVTKEELSKRSRLYICGLGLYEAYLNGEKIGDQYLTPYFTDYRYRIQYQTYDVSCLLKEGENILDVFLGDGWYKGRFGYLASGQLREYYGDRFLLLADLCIGNRVIATDESWTALRSSVINSGIYDGETYDARRDSQLSHPTLREVTGVQIAHGPTSLLTPMIGLPALRHETFPVANIIITPRKETVLDFGQEITGWVEFEVTPSEEKNHHILLEYGEVLQDGCFYNDNLRSASAKFSYTADGTDKKVRPHFTFYGFRYVKVTGLDADVIRERDFKAVAIYSDLQEIGEISTPIAKLNRLILNTKWGQKGNFLDIPTDCPQRDERCGWTGDAAIFSGAASYHMQTGTFFRKYLLDMADEQREKNGAVPYVVPDVLTIGRQLMAEPSFDQTSPDWGEAGSCVWGDAATIIPWNMYLHSGNVSRLAEQYDNMKQWTDFIMYMDEKHCDGSRLWTCGFHFGDWLSLDVEGGTKDESNCKGGTDRYFIASVFYMYAARLTAKAAKILGYDEDAGKYGKRADEVRTAIRNKYLDKSSFGKLLIRTQTAYAVAIHLDIFEEKEKDAAGKELEALVHEWKDHLATGFVGTAFLCDALTQTGHVDLAYTLLFNEDYPSWLYEVNLGATTIWERWNSILPDGKISGTGMNSLNHYAYGVIVEWIYKSVCGLNLDEEHPAGQRIIFSPHPDKRLGSVTAKVNFAKGSYEAGWKLSEDKVTLNCTVPFGGELLFRPDFKLENILFDGNKVDNDFFKDVITCGTHTIEGKIMSR